MLRIDTHHHAIPAFYRELLRKAGFDAAAGLETYAGLDAGTRGAIERGNALALFPRLGAAAPSEAGPALDQVRRTVSRAVMRGVVRLINTR